MASAYKKLSQREHVLHRPGMYIGSTEGSPGPAMYLLGAVEADGRRTMVLEPSLPFIPGLYKIFDEIVVNALDQVYRLGKKGVGRIDVSVDSATGVIEVSNDGAGLPVEVHPEHGCYVPELIFGHMLTSTNYDDSEERTVGGQNGIGAKACNIFSKWFEVHTVDTERGLTYSQRFDDNMDRVGAPEVAPIGSKKKKPYVRIRFLPDYARFGVPEGLPHDMFRVLEKRSYDVAALTPSDVAVFFNGERIAHKTFDKYVDLFLSDTAAGPTKVYERVDVGSNTTWEVAAGLSADGFQHVSFVNGLNTVRGGKHVDFLVQQITRRIIELFKNKRGGGKDAIKPQFVRDSLFLFVRATIPNPTFDSQTKDTLTTPSTKFGGAVSVSDRFIEKLSKLEGFADRISAFSGLAVARDQRKTDGSKRGAIYGIKKLDDAEWAGTNKSPQCTLILTEGDSAKAMAVAGLSVVGRKKYGVFPLRGKVMNVCDVSQERISSNEEITNLKKIIGLQAGKEYEGTDSLRYGRIMVMTDQDTDGTHIKGLLFNLFHQLWPSLLRIEGFMTSMLTPIVKATLKRPPRTTLSFYNVSDFERWRLTEGCSASNWHAKYYKGLGTSTSAEAREYFRELRVVRYLWTDTTNKSDALSLSFDKKRADDRKTWLQSYDPAATLDYTSDRVSFKDFVDLDLKHFSNYDVMRSIPSAIDGFKVSQRKAIYGCFKRNLHTEEVRVAQLAAYVSEHSMFHHGEASMQGTLIAMAQTFVGSGNNVNLLEPIGQFGSRLAGGSDHASPRYIHTRLEHVTRLIFPKEDDKVLEHATDDGVSVEPVVYIPVIPMVLVNGAMGIGTGYSTSVPCYDPIEIIGILRDMLDDIGAASARGAGLQPYYRGFVGSCKEVATRTGLVGIVERISPNKARILELPIGLWTDDFKEALEALVSECPEMKSCTNESTEDKVSFVVTFDNRDSADDWVTPTGSCSPLSRLESRLKMFSTKPLATSNMHLFNRHGQIRKYNSPMEVINEFFEVRMGAYLKRKESMSEELRTSLFILEQKTRFVELVTSRIIDLHHAPDDDVVEEEEGQLATTDAMLIEHGLKAVDGSFRFLLAMPMASMTRKRKHQLEAEREAKREELEALERTDTKTMYCTDLDRVEKELLKMRVI